nr:hypothetical protein [uncultured Pseudomonas sp.]
MSTERRNPPFPSYSDSELRKLLTDVQHGTAIHPRLSDLLVHLRYLEQRSCGLYLTLKAHRLIRRPEDQA